MFVRAFVLPALTPCALFYLSSLAIVRCAACGDNGSHTHTHTDILVKCLQEDVSVFQTYYTRESPPQFIKLVSMELINQTGSQDVRSVHGLTSRQLELLLFFIKACQNSVGTSSNDFSLLLMFVFTE